MGLSIPSRDMGFSGLHNGTGGHPASYGMGRRSSFLGAVVASA